MKRIRNDTFFCVLNEATMYHYGTAVIQAEPIIDQIGGRLFLCEVRYDNEKM